jgi:hypothetical protein
MADSRQNIGKRIRRERFDEDYPDPFPKQMPNGEEQQYRNRNYIANYTKGMHHHVSDEPSGKSGEVVKDDYEKLLRAIDTGKIQDFKAIPRYYDESHIPPPRRYTNPQSGLAFDVEGIDSHGLKIPKAPKISEPTGVAEMVELYWMAILRDMNFKDFTDPNKNAMVIAAVNDLNMFNDIDEFKDLNPSTLFRGFTDGDKIGPYISQFLLRGNVDPMQGYKEEDGFVKYGVCNMNQRIIPAKTGIDFMTEYSSWLDVQNGLEISIHPLDKTIANQYLDPNLKFISTPRDLATYVHWDALYQAYLTACFYLLRTQDYAKDDQPFVNVMNEGLLNPGNPYIKQDYKNQMGFGTFGDPHILSLVTEVATRALKTVWYQKWFVHRRLRPEAFGGLIHRKKMDGIDYSINDRIMGTAVLQKIFDKYGTYLLPQAFTEGSPLHPSYGAGHGTVAGACVTILKFWFNEELKFKQPLQPNDNGTLLEPYNGPDKDDLTLGGELNKLAANIAIGRNMAGVHYRSDYTRSLLLGEKVAVGILMDQRKNYNEKFSMKFRGFDGNEIKIKNN